MGEADIIDVAVIYIERQVAVCVDLKIARSAHCEQVSLSLYVASGKGAAYC